MTSKTFIAALLLALATAISTIAGAASRPAAAADRAMPRSVVQPRPAAGQPRAHPAVPAFEYAYAPPVSPGLQEIYWRVRDADLWQQLPEVHAIDGMFALPRRLRFVTAECGEFGAFYRPGDAEVVLCYETLRTLYERGVEHQQALGLGEDHPLRYVRANVRFIVLHETGHALVHLLDLPVTGRQEDAVDQLAGILMLRFAGLDETPEEVTGNLGLAANWMLSDSTGAYNLQAYADEHALAEQRFFNLQCLIYGTDPDGFAGMVAVGDLTAARAMVCPRDTRRVSRAWLRLLLPHLAPGYEAYGDEAARYLERSGREEQAAQVAG
ncbi:DUF4344 domain-containing metallopeptidase [Pseudoxanthomonas koreensis]|uniref:DUF4344 domain-containing metallopeptidase n=1 Tax=Pseudoxanthomonas koreensis TaxID=266061 RepID=UPI001EE424AC|nr:DUF4344 domain-containing metallopeptidase [Pseudoxanthomonas koreensis]